jgi:S1-C subfamily serine protease
MSKWVVPLLLVIALLGTGANGWLVASQARTIRDDEAVIAGLRADLDTTSKGLDAVSATVQTLSGDVSSLSSSVTAIETESSNSRASAGALSATVNDLSSAVSRLTAQVNDVKQAVASSAASDFIAATAATRPAVVVIQVQITTVIFGRTFIQQGEASGWIINSSGIIVTNDHVVSGATSITVTLADGRTFPSVAVRSDPSTDLAVIKINALNLPVAKVGDSSKLQVGQPVAAVGNAVGLGINVTGGLVSRLNASITVNSTSLSGLIGTDAAINPGNSGGPLVNMAGEVVGITNAKLVETGVEGIGYAININDALTTINRLMAGL